jgi:hypothetical protein
MILWQIEGDRLGLRPVQVTALILFGGLSWSAVEFSTFLWNPNLCFFLTTCFFVGVGRIQSDPTSAWWIPLLIVTAAFPQFHLVGIAFAPALVLSCAFLRITPRGKSFVIGVTRALLVWVT